MSKLHYAILKQNPDQKNRSELEYNVRVIKMPDNVNRHAQSRMVSEPRTNGGGVFSAIFLDILSKNQL